MTHADSASLSNKVYLITGASGGIGRATALALAARDAHVVLACRSESKTLPVIDDIKTQHPKAKVDFLALDLGDFDSVRACADAFLALNLPLHGLINNAGVAGKRGLTKSGFELAFGINHLGHFLLTLLLVDKLKASAPSRVVTVASTAHYRAKPINFNQLRTATSTQANLGEYAVSKLCNILFTAELGRRLQGTGVTTYTLHPGVVASDIWRHVPRILQPLIKLFMISNEKGARTTLHCATSPDVADETGMYFDACKHRKPSRDARDQQLAKTLWEKSAEWTGVDLPPAS